MQAVLKQKPIWNMDIWVAMILGELRSYILLLNVDVQIPLTLMVPLPLEFSSTTK